MVQLYNPACPREHAKRMLEARVLCAGEDQVVQTQLATSAQALKERVLKNWQIATGFDGTGTGYAKRVHCSELIVASLQVKQFGVGSRSFGDIKTKYRCSLQ